MQASIDVIMVMELNELLKQHHIDYTLHTVGGCSCCGMELECTGESYPIDEIIKVINEYLSQKWLVASYQESYPLMIYIDTKFNKG